MTLEEMLIAVNKNLDEFRAAGDIKAFNATKVMKDELLREMGKEVAREFINSIDTGSKERWERIEDWYNGIQVETHS